ncbi:helix-turn-helix transcriptional regulator [Fodinicurvata sediminis]|uniref:helix-turn-helix transcriptional regulator n=1 Tax=Fodinicurvata sediminis TaxID=1121832 RepID=UPI0003B37BF3|nr:helix-turn-helix transcriptional regulator [Fodinicurvata sediminis]
MDLMTTAEVADYLRLKERTVYEMASRQQIPCTRATGKLLFSRKLIERWVEGRTDLPLGYDAAAAPIYAGSSDPLLEWALRESGCGLALLTSGSRDGLERLARGEALLAGLHLKDPNGEGYNVETIRREIPFPDVVAIRFAERAQGLLVAPGNPLGIGELDDLARRRPRLLLRPEGTGSRSLFDALTEAQGLNAGELNLLSGEAQTEGDLATLIAEGEADCGLGIAAAARRHGLDFVPLGVQESFDLVMRRRDYFEPPIQRLLALLASAAFRRRAESHGGYDLTRQGQVTYNG